MFVRIRAVFLALILCMVFLAHPASAGTGKTGSAGITIMVDGTVMKTLWKIRPGVRDHLVPLADFARHAGAAYSFYPGSGVIVISKGDRVLELCMDRARALINGSEFTLGQPPGTSDGVIYVPLGATASALGYSVSVQGKNSIYLTYGPPGKRPHPNSPSVSSVSRLLPPGSELIKADGGGEGMAGETVIKGDADGDGSDEYAALYRKNDGKYGVMLYRAQDGRYSKIWLKEEDSPPSLLELKDFNGGGSELLVGWNFGEPLGSYLEIFTFRGGAPELLYGGLYHRLDLGDFDGDGYPEFAAWQKDAGSTYSVELFKWDGGMFSPQEYQPRYYSGVVDYYKGINVSPGQKRAVRYYLAEAYLRSREFSLALQAAEEGLLHNPDHITNSHFYKLKGLALAGLERYDEALPYLRKSLEGRPGPVWPEARYALSRCYIKKGDIYRGRLELARALNEGNRWQGYERAREALRLELTSSPD